MKQKTFSIIIGSILLAFAAHVHAASIIVQTPKKPVAAGQMFPIDILLDAEGQSINSISVSLIMPVGVSLRKSDTSDSIIGLWLEKPKSGTRETPLALAGVIPTGFGGLIDPFSPKKRLPGKVVRLYVSADAAATQGFVVADVHAYLNDGKGTEVPVSVRTGTIADKDLKTLAADTIAPLPFQPLIVRDPLMFDGRPAVVFDTRDDESGIDRFEVREGDGEWVEAQSPYPLSVTSYPTVVSVKAFDQFGNERLAMVTKPGSKPVKAPVPWTRIFGVVGLILGILAVGFLERKK
jgi:hypothetical protein